MFGASLVGSSRTGPADASKPGRPLAAWLNRTDASRFGLAGAARTGVKGAARTTARPATPRRDATGAFRLSHSGKSSIDRIGPVWTGSERAAGTGRTALAWLGRTTATSLGLAGTYRVDPTEGA